MEPKKKTSLLIGVILGIGSLVIILAFAVLMKWAMSQWSQEPPIMPHAHCEAVVDSERTASITLDQSRYSSMMAGLAAQRDLAPRAVSIAITTALQESDIRNLDHGDRDSIGLFQQRPSQGWGTVEEIMDPHYSINAFYDVMVQVDNWQSADIGDVAQEVQRSGFPDEYDKHVDRAKILASALSGDTPAAWSCVLGDTAEADPDLLASSLNEFYGKTVSTTITPATETEPAQVTVSATSEQVAWSVGAFAQSWATHTGVTSVWVGIYQWTASSNTLAGWIANPDTKEASTTVIISF